jgi:hypothetical protein
MATGAEATNIAEVVLSAFNQRENVVGLPKRLASVEPQPFKPPTDGPDLRRHLLRRQQDPPTSLSVHDAGVPLALGHKRGLVADANGLRVCMAHGTHPAIAGEHQRA